MPKTSSPKPVDQLSYEEAFAELQQTVEQLEGEERALEASIALFERGQALLKRCSELLEKAELKIRQLSGGEEVDFEEEA
jgi:exodeoxyribonuclease VII small subunit